MNRPRVPVAVLGATGAVGQTFVRLLRRHPFFELREVAASQRSAGRPYREAVHWLEGELPDAIGDLEVRPCTPEAVRSRVVFSALDASVAGEVEASFARAGATVLSNARAYRMDDDVPLVIPEVNASHLALVRRQRRVRSWEGAIVTNANCATTVLALSLAPLHEAAGVRTAFVATLQAASGAGYPGVPSLDLLGNVVPYIAGEEEKIEVEASKILGRLEDFAVAPAAIRMSVHANRVPVEHGHTVCVTVELNRAVEPEEASELWRRWRGHPLCHGLPSAPDPPLALCDDPDRPQPRRDVWAGHGMRVLVGRVRPDPVAHLRFAALGHNTVRGAAGGSVLNAEVMGRMGLLPDVKEGAW